MSNKSDSRIYAPTIPFTQVPNDFLRDNTISSAAKGIFTMMLSHAQSFNLKKKDISKFVPEGDFVIDRVWSELRSRGYITSNKEYNKESGIVEWCHHLHLSPVVANEGGNPLGSDTPPSEGSVSEGSVSDGSVSDGSENGVYIEEQNKNNTIQNNNKEKQKGKSKKSDGSAKPIVDPVEEFVSLFESNEYRLAAKDFIQHRKEKKSPVTALSLSRIANDLKKWGEDASIVALEKSIKNGWAGVFKPSQKDIDDVKAEKPTGYEHLLGYRADLQNNPDYRFNISPDNRSITYNKKW